MAEGLSASQEGICFISVTNVRRQAAVKTSRILSTVSQTQIGCTSVCLWCVPFYWNGATQGIPFALKIMSLVHRAKSWSRFCSSTIQHEGRAEKFEDEKCDVTIMKEGMNVSMKTIERIEPRQRKGAAVEEPSSQRPDSSGLTKDYGILSTSSGEIRRSDGGIY